ncbi:MAG: papain-like cysteine peptidase [Roseburia sp.]|nr:papain-like cysteine peptidase [Roseburia sp.]MCM1099009.1 papain-like cysteine peptidase [Ruminococcus flavefaciens]
MSKLGLRNFSGPFDWFLSDFDSVINQIDKEFIDFMKKENLEIIDNNPKAFRNIKYNFYCNHDIKENFETEYIDIYNKYIRRAK